MSRRGAIAGAGVIPAGGAPAFSPDDVAGLKVWAEADLALADAAPLVSWTELKNGWNGAPAGGPIYKTGIFPSGLGAVRCDGTDDSVLFTAPSAFVTGTGVTVFLLAIRRGASTSAMALIGSANSDDFAGTGGALIGYEAGGAQHSNYRQTAEQAIINSHPGDNVPFVLRTRWDGADNYMRRVTSGGAIDATMNTFGGGSFSTDRVILGRRWESGAPGGPARYDYGAVLVYDSFISDAGDLAAIEAYMVALGGL